MLTGAFSVTDHRPSILRHFNLATLANFWKLQNLSGVKTKSSSFFSSFD